MKWKFILFSSQINHVYHNHIFETIINISVVKPDKTEPVYNRILPYTEKSVVPAERIQLQCMVNILS